MPKHSVSCPSCGQSFLYEVKQNNRQLEEIVRKKKPLLIQAGPGTGKTYALAFKIKHLVKNEKVPKDSITVITFTNEAAINMRKTLSTEGDEESPYLEPEKQPSAIWTMHKLGHQIIDQNASALGWSPGIKVIPSKELKNILIQDAAQLVSGAKRNDGLETIKCREQGECATEEAQKCAICSRYRELLRAYNYVDHDDQILLACKVLSENDDILKKVQRGAKYLLVDEYQDINNAQWKLIKLLSKGNTNNLFVVGDEYQSIYNFRGGHPKYIRNFKNDYGPDAEELTLLTSRRCPPNILKGAFSMVHKYCAGDIAILNKLEFTNKSPAMINTMMFSYQNQEAAYLAKMIKGIGPSYDVLVLVPWIDYAEPIKSQLRGNHVSFSCEYDLEKTGLRLINVLLSWLKKPNDFDLRLLIGELISSSILAIPGERREDALKQISGYWGEHKERKTLYTKLKSFKDNEDLIKLKDIIVELKSSYKLSNEHLEFIMKLIEKLNVWRSIPAFTKEMNSIYDEVKSLVPSGENSVRIMTMKKAKGLAADYVFIIGVEEDVMPFANANEFEKAEASRLLYVSMTRAIKELYLFNCTSRNRHITKTVNKVFKRSELIEAIPRQYITDMGSTL